uniref:Uncharacterized protein n=1 Tax=Oryza meridionalis TaxID=40149 RepID=A0A0E0D1F7_9ORYZ
MVLHDRLGPTPYDRLGLVQWRRANGLVLRNGAARWPRNHVRPPSTTLPFSRTAGVRRCRTAVMRDRSLQDIL